MPVAMPDPDAPLWKLAPAGGWLSEPAEYAVRAEHAEQALDLALYIHLLHGGKIPLRYREHVAQSFAALSELAGLRAFSVLVGHKPGPGRNTRWLSSEITVIEDQTAGIQQDPGFGISPTHAAPPCIPLTVS